MRGAVLYGPGDVRYDESPEPTIVDPTDAIIRMSVTCICGSDLWPYRGLNPASGPAPMGHEYCGIVEELGRDVASIKRGQFVIGSPLHRVRVRHGTATRLANTSSSPLASDGSKRGAARSRRSGPGTSSGLHQG